MQILRTVPNLPGPDLEASRRLFRDALGYTVVMDLGWIVTFAAPGLPHTQISAVAQDPSGLHPDVSIEVDDVESAHAAVEAQGLEIVYPMQDEPWGVRRFFVREPGGRILNVVMHR